MSPDHELPRSGAARPASPSRLAGAQMGPLGVLAVGLVTSVGADAEASCAALRAGVRNPVTAAILDAAGEPLVVHQAPIDVPWSFTERLLALATAALHDCLDDHAMSGTADALSLPLVTIACLPEAVRPGRPADLDTTFLARLAAAADVPIDVAHSCVVPGGRASVLVALAHARGLIRDGVAGRVMIVAADSFLVPETLYALLADDRLLTSGHSDGFLPGEAGGALLVGAPGPAGQLLCEGLGFGVEHAAFDTGRPHRADGLVKAIRAALAEARCTTADTAFRLGDNSGEHYYFREAALAIQRTWRGARAQHDVWLPAQCFGETGAASGAAMVAAAVTACRGDHAPGPRMLMHASTDGSHRAAGVFAWRRRA